VATFAAVMVEWSALGQTTGMIIGFSGSVLGVESAILALAMVYSLTVDCGQAVVGGVNIGGGRPRRQLRGAPFLQLGDGKSQPNVLQMFRYD
jgi:hypothetical protein